MISQTGGVLYLLVWIISIRFKLGKLKSAGLFLAIYLAASFIIIPFVAPWFGRHALPVRGQLRPVSLATCILNRHYVTRDLRQQLVQASEEMANKFEGTEITYLDANFPFFDGFPLIPHLSHNDGRKVDLAFYYLDKETKDPLSGSPSWMGYGVFVEPEPGEVNYPERCRKEGYWQYGALEYFAPGWKADRYQFDEKRTRYLLKWLARDQRTSKIFIEPHLKDRLRLKRFKNIRFHGCHAVRHDDHIHLQVN